MINNLNEIRFHIALAYANAKLTAHMQCDDEYPFADEPISDSSSKKTLYDLNFLQDHFRSGYEFLLLESDQSIEELIDPTTVAGVRLK